MIPTFHPYHHARILILSSLLILFTETRGQAQTRDYPALNALYKAGQINELRTELQRIPESDQEDAGLLFLRGVAETNADKAIVLFQSIVSNHPDSEWADDALYKLYQYSYSIGAYNTADKHLSHLKVTYPKSPYLTREGTQSAATELGKYSVQVGAFINKNDAQFHFEEMKKHGYSVELQSKTVGGKTFTAVWIGVFDERSGAEAYARKLKARHDIDAIVVRR